LKEKAHRTRRPFKTVVNEALRAGLANQRKPPARRYRLKPRSLGGVVAEIDLDRDASLHRQARRWLESILSGSTPVGLVWIVAHLASDAHLAALGIERAAAVYSTDNDFKRFPGLEHVNPLEP
jgi:hypothetical protein